MMDGESVVDTDYAGYLFDQVHQLGEDGAAFDLTDQGHDSGLDVHVDGCRVDAHPPGDHLAGDFVAGLDVTS